jgi:uncharacterized protein (DUF2461 family)
MPYSAEGFEKCTSKEIQDNIERREYQLERVIEHDNKNPVIPKIQEQLEHLRADLILKKHEESKQEMKELLNRLLELVKLI